MDDAWVVIKDVGVMGLSFSDFTTMLDGGAEAGTETGSGTLRRRSLVVGGRATLASGQPVDLRHAGMYSSSSFPSSE